MLRGLMVVAGASTAPTGARLRGLMTLPVLSGRHRSRLCAGDLRWSPVSITGIAGGRAMTSGVGRLRVSMKTTEAIMTKPVDPIVAEALALLTSLRDKGKLNGNEIYLAQDLHRFIINQERVESGGGGLSDFFKKPN